MLILDKGKLVAEDTAEGLSRQSAGRGETLIRVRAPMQDVLRALGDCPGVQDAKVVDRDPSGMVAIVVSSDGEGDPRPLLAKTVVESGWSLHEIGPHEISLEDLFVRILEQAEGAKPAEPERDDAP